MRFHLGKPILAMLLLAAVCGTTILLRRARPTKDLTVWTFAEPHANAYRPLLPEFEQRTGRTVDLQLVPTAAMNVRLAGLFMSDRPGRPAAEGVRDAPDLVELGMDAVGQYFRPPVRDVGFLPLNGYLENSGWREIKSPDAPGRAGWNARSRADGRIYTYRDGHWHPNPARPRPDAWIDRIAAGRLAPWTKDGVAFGVPHDVHPMTLTYRKDLFDRAGVDLTTPTAGRDHLTWPDFQDRCLRFQAYWSNPSHWTPADGPPHPRHAMELLVSKADHLATLLLQRGVNLIDADGQLHLTDDLAVRTLAFYSQLVCGPRRVAAESAAGAGPWANDLVAGNTCATLTPDWRAQDLRTYGGPLAGRVRMIPLPRFDPADAPTSTWSGTMIGIPRFSRRPDDAWRLIEHLYFDDAALAARVRTSGILPPVKDCWGEPYLHEPDPFFGGQRVMEDYVNLADQVPPRAANWATPVAQAAMGYVLNEANDYVRSGKPVDGLEAYVRQELRRVAVYVRRSIDHGTFEDGPPAGG